MNQPKFYVTTPIYYVNDQPHIGHAYTTILADVLARYHRLIGQPTFFLTGTDEHGQKVQQAAQKDGISPQEQADRTVVRFQDLWRKLEITHDDFIRTTEPRHTAVVQEILQELYDRGEIYRAEYDGWYDVGSETFVTEKDLPEGTSPEDLPNIVRIRESNYFFKMGQYRDWLIQYIEEHPAFIQPDFRRNETLGFLRNELGDLCISRPKQRLAWGIELPFDSDFVCYVWFDALVNYISAIGYRREQESFQQWWPAEYHLIGKDILITHTVYWPTMLKAMDLPLPRTIFAHGWWLTGNTKMSKSLGNVVNPMEMADRYGVDPFRYFLMAEMTLGQDASFSEDAFVRRYNTDLANDLGNLLNRVLKMIHNYADGRLPRAQRGCPDADGLKHVALQCAEDMVAAVEHMRLDQGLAAVAGVMREANRYLEKKQPWTLGKEGRSEELGTVLYTSAETLRIISGLLFPVMPGKMLELRRLLGLSGQDPDVEQLREWGVLKAGAPVGKTKGLFPRIQVSEKKDTASAADKKSGGNPSSVTTGGRIAYDDVAKVQLRVARILSAEAVQGADKLLRLQVDLGGETRQLVAGIAKAYAPEDLPGKTIVVVANLQPATIRGVESNGMLLAADDGKTMRLLTVDGELPPGAVVK